MAQKEPETGPSLELPSLFGRRKRRAEQPSSEVPGDTATVPRVDEPTEDTTVIPPVDEPTEDTTVIPPVDPAPPPPTAHTPAVTPTPVPTPTRAPAEGTARPAGGRRRAGTKSRSIPEVAGSTAAFLVGAVVGLAGCVLTYVGLQGCELITGTGSCGGPGLLVLAVILVAMVLLGTVILRTLRVPDPGNVSFLGVGMLTVIALVFLIDYLYDPWMFVVVPAVTAVSYGAARWVTTLYAEDVLGDDDGMPHHDIR